MATYERTVDGEVVETVHLVDGGFEDTRVGSLALDGAGGWTKVDQSAAPTGPAPVVPAAPQPDPSAKPVPKPKPAS